MVRPSDGVLKVRVQPAGVALLLRPGGRLLDAADELPEPPLDFACRDATCGLCLVEVLRGAALLQPPAEDERRTLAALHAGAPLRLGCQVCAGDRAGDVVLAPRREPRVG